MNKPEQVPPSEEEEDEDEEEEGCQKKKDFKIEEQNSVKQQQGEELLLLPCKEVNLGSAMIKEKPREKKKTTNGNGNNNGGGATGGGTGSGSASMEIKTEPADRERENEIVKEEPAVLPDEAVSMSADKSAENSPIPEAKNTPCSQPDICMPEAVKAEEGTLVENPVNPVKTLKNEETEPEFGTDCPDMGETVQNVLPMLTSAATEPLLDGVQPLASNVINKQPGTMEAQYMQQQSQIFVFSTALANKSAESVIQGQYTSIIAYHCAQPRTKKYLEKHPLKMNQFSRQNPAQWLNNLAQIKQKGGGPGMGPGQGPMGPMGGPMKFMAMNRGGAPPPPPPPNTGGPVKNNMMMDMGHPMGIPPNRMPMWNQCVQGCSGPMSMKGPMPSNVDGPGVMAGSPNSNSMMQVPGAGQMPSLADFTDTDAMGLGTHHSLAGVKVPDENLTPQQRQHREEQLATLRKMQQMLFPEHHSPGEQQPPPGPVQCPVSVSTSVPGAPVPQCPPNSVAGPPGPTDLDEVIPLTSDPGDMMMPHHKNPPTMAAQAEWQKMQLQFYEERKKKGTCVTLENPGGVRTGSRTQGPPPPYHQTTRSASVPIAMPSPNPSSPNNTTSNLSLPSPRTCSGLNSPAGRHPPGPSPTAPLDSPGHTLNPSNPGTPVSLSTHLSPKKDKHNGSSEFSPTSSQQSPDGMYCRTLQNIAQQKQQPPTQQPGQTQPQQQASSISKEPNLMPVPSPQQIQYLNAFEGQELTIQKQPNTSLKESSIMSPTLPPTSLESVLPTSGADITNKVSGPLTPSSLEMGVNRAVFSGTSPSPGTVAADKNRPVACQNSKTDSRFSCNSPQMPDSITSSRFPMMGSSPGLSSNFMQQQPPKPGPHFLEISPNGKSNCAAANNDGSIKDQGSGNYQCVGQDNVPLNPNGVTRMGMGLGNGVKSSNFDPISSLAQMSQQLTNVAGSPGGQSGNMLHPGVMPFNNPPGNMHLMQMNDMGVCQDGIRMGNPQMTGHPHSFSPGSNGSGRMVPCPGNNNSVSPKPGLMQPGPSYPGPMGQRMMNRPPVSNSYNGANIQVKPSAPNTIQYLPTRTQTGQSAGPRGPPSLDFLQRFSNPLSNLDAKVPTHNLQYFPNNYQQNNSVNTSDMNMLGNINCGGMNQGIGMIRGAVRGGTGGMLRVGMPQVGFGGGDGMFPGASSGPGPGSCQMFVPGGKGSPGMGMGVPPDASQPLPPSMGQSNSFKNSSFIGPTTSDPNYAQQFHNFQQQLYATNTRSQMSNQAMGANQQFFVPK